MPPEQRDQEAARLYDAYGAPLYRYALTLLASREAAEDVVHQVFLALIERQVRMEDEERYLRRAVRNACYSALRRRVRRTHAAAHDWLESVEAHGPAVAPEDRIALAAAIRQLPMDQREVLHLHAFEGRTFRDIAETTGESANTVASRYRYALEKLKALLTKAQP